MLLEYANTKGSFALTFDRHIGQLECFSSHWSMQLMWKALALRQQPKDLDVLEFGYADGIHSKHICHGSLLPWRTNV
ncbi:unnamed protein product [Linum trigynum]|uniref:Uncharacterized protein n=1 Tax=Linum trigynum TaxID=586398 RepID=A0AAV2FM98_9ROSI